MTETVVDRPGIVQKATDRVGLIANRICARAAGYEVDQSVGAVDATFRARYGLEWSRVTTLMGERPALEAFVGVLQPDHCVWDVGACIGMYSAFAARIVDSRAGGRVHAIESSPYNMPRLVDNLALNGQPDGDNWQVHNLALSDRDGRVQLDIPWRIPGAAAVVADTKTAIPVKSRSPTGLADETGPPDVCKIDVDGHEDAILRSIQPILGDIDHLFIEFHAHKGCQKEDYLPALRDRGFSSAVVCSSGGAVVVHCARSDGGSVEGNGGENRW